MLLALVFPAWSSSWSASLPDLWREDGGAPGDTVSIGGDGAARAGVLAVLIEPEVGAEGFVIVNDPSLPLVASAAVTGLSGTSAVCVFSLAHGPSAVLVARDPLLGGEGRCGAALDVSTSLHGMATLDLAVRQGGVPVASSSVDVLLNDTPRLRYEAAAFGPDGHGVGAGSFPVSVQIADDWWAEGESTLTLVVTAPDGSVLAEETHEAAPGPWSGEVVHLGAVGRYEVEATFEDGYGASATITWPVTLVEDPEVSLSTDVLDHAEPGDEVGLTATVSNRSGPFGTSGTARVQRDADGAWSDVGSCAVATGTVSPSCTVSWPSGTTRGWASFRAVYEEASTGAVATSALVEVLVDDAPALTASWEDTSGAELVVERAAEAWFRAWPEDADVDEDGGAGDAVTWVVCRAGEAASYAGCEGGSAVDGGSKTVTYNADHGLSARAAFTPKEHGSFELWVRYEDPWGLSAESGPYVAHVNAAPTAELTGVTTGPQEDLEDGVLRVPAGARSYDALLVAFWTGDGDDATVEVEAATDFESGSVLSCASATNLGDCTLTITGLSTAATGAYDVTVTVTDDVESVASVLLTVEIVDGTTFDHDGDGYVASPEDGLAADCEPLDATVNPGAADVCDAVDNDCDGQANDAELGYDNEWLAAAAAGEAYVAGTVSASDATTIEDSTGAACVVSGTTACVAEGSLYAEDDADWWGFELGTDGEDVHNAAFSLEVEVPSGALGATASPWDWALDLRVSDDGEEWYTMDEMYARTGIQYVTEPTTTGGTRVRPTLTWEVATSDRQYDELHWRVGIGSTLLDEDASWNEDMCGTSGAPVYTLTVSD